MTPVETLANTRDHVTHFQGRMKRHSSFSLIPEILEKDFQWRKTSLGTKLGASLGARHGKEWRSRTSVRTESGGRRGVTVKVPGPTGARRSSPPSGSEESCNHSPGELVLSLLSPSSDVGCLPVSKPLDQTCAQLPVLPVVSGSALCLSWPLDSLVLPHCAASRAGPGLATPWP